MKNVKQIFVINGLPRSGKDTFVNEFNCIYNQCISLAHVHNYSLVHNVKEIAKKIGWNGEKDDKSRKFLSDLKDLTDKYNNFSLNATIKEIEAFLYNEEEMTSNSFLFIHARDPQDIEFICNKYNAKSILIRRLGNEIIDRHSEYSNHADCNVYDYTYDYEITNPGTKIDDYDANIKLFIGDFLNDYKCSRENV